MKKIILLLMGIVLFSTSLYAQENRFSWGPKAALNLSNLYGSDVDGAHIKVGYQLGLVGEYRLTSLIAIAPEIMFSNQGTKQDKTTCNLNYINIPLMAKFYVCKPLSIDFGPEFGYAVFNHVDGTKIDSDLYHKFNFGLGLGATYNFDHLFVDARFSLGLTDVVKDSSNKNYNIQIGAGYKF